jgi:hypothetical protein
MDSSDGHCVQSQATERTNRTYFTDPGLARRLDLLNAATPDASPTARHDNILYDSETAKSTSYYAEDQRQQVHEHTTVVQVHITRWTELVIRPIGAAEATNAILWLINKPQREWHRASRIARDLLAFADLSQTHAISVPIQHGRMLWIPSLNAVRHLITIGPSKHVRMQWGNPQIPHHTPGI